MAAKYGSDPSIVGAVFNMDNKPFTVVGITPPSFFGDTLRSDPPDFFLPLNTEPLVPKRMLAILTRLTSTGWT